MTTFNQLLRENEALTETAGDLFIKNFELNIQLALAVKGLKMAMPYVMTAEQAKAKAEGLTQIRSNASLASWPLHTVTVNGDGLKLSAAPNWQKRSKVTETKIDESGKDAAFKTVTTAEVDVEIDFGFFGKQTVTGAVVNVETGMTGSNDVQIENTLTFHVNIAGKVQGVRISVKGEIVEACFGLAAGHGDTTALLNPDAEYCGYCNNYHEEDKVNVEVSIN